MAVVLLCMCVYDGRSVISRIAPRARMRERARVRLLGGVCCVFVLLLVMCAVWGAQHFIQHSFMLAAARALPEHVATAMCAGGSPAIASRFVRRPGQQAFAGQVEYTVLWR